MFDVIEFSCEERVFEKQVQHDRLLELCSRGS